MAATTLLFVADTAVQQDAAGRYSLNDLHRAAGGEDRHKPGHWLQTAQAQELAVELGTDGGIPPSVDPVSSIRGGLNQGTFVVRELVYAYAMWISARFHLQVIRAYDALVTGGVADALGKPTGSLTVPHALAAQRQVERLMAGVLAASNEAVRQVLHGLLARNCTVLGIPVPALADLVAPKPVPAGGGNPKQGSLPGLGTPAGAAA